MQVTPEQREQAARLSLNAADTWAGKGEVGQELACRLNALTALLSAAVARCADEEEGIAYLRAADVPELIRRVADLNDQLYAALQQHGKPVAGAVSTSSVAVHAAWLLGEMEAAGRLLRPSTDPLVRKFFPTTPFWAEYNRGLACIASGTPYEPELPKLRGYEKYWAPYLNLIRDLTGGTDPAASRQAIRTSFEKRNQDRKLTDWEMIDGDALYPLRWDFRAASIDGLWVRS